MGVQPKQADHPYLHQQTILRRTHDKSFKGRGLERRLVRARSAWYDPHLQNIQHEDIKLWWVVEKKLIKRYDASRGDQWGARAPAQQTSLVPHQPVEIRSAWFVAYTQRTVAELEPLQWHRLEQRSDARTLSAV
jgi:hypothetical protein